MTALVYYSADQMSVADVANGDCFDASKGAEGDSTSPRFKKYFQSPEFEDGVVYYVTEVDLYSTTGEDETANGAIFNVMFNLVGDHAAGAEFTYGVKLKEASNANGDEITFAGKQEGKVTATPDPYKDVYNNFTVFTTDGTVDVGTKEVTVDLRLVNNPGINAIRIFIAYDEALQLTSLQPVDGIFTGSEFEVSEDKHADPSASASAKNAFEHKNISLDGKACAIILATADKEENRTAGGVLARLTFALPEDMKQGDSFPIDFCWTGTDVVQLDMDNMDEYGKPVLKFLEPDNPTCAVGTKVCEHPNVVLTETKAATCTETGLKSGECPDCGQTVEEEIPMIPHTPSADKKVTPPTCTEAGKITTVCDVCKGDIETVEDPDNPALGHDDVNVKENITKAATCKEAGLKNILCGRCDVVLQENVEIAKLPHTEATRVEAPTCTEGGKIVTYCSVCNEIIKTEVDPDHAVALGHTAGAPVVTKPATCKEEGSQDIYCTVCEEKIATESIAMLEHDVVTEVVDPTCVDAGKIVEKCSMCGEVFSEEEDAEHPATGVHTPGEPEIVEPTATEEGTKTIKCSVCGEVLSTEKIPAKGVDSSDADTTTKAPDKNTGKNPVTGDNMVYVIVIAALAVVGCSAVVVIRKKKASER